MTASQKLSLKLIIVGLVVFIAPLIWLFDLAIRFNIQVSEDLFLGLFILAFGGLGMVFCSVMELIFGPTIPRRERSYYSRSYSSSDYDD